MIDYQVQGKRSYDIASRLKAAESHSDQGAVLRRLSHEFELCSNGLRRVRAEWERLPGANQPLQN
jgi:hypothetical protein